MISLSNYFYFLGGACGTEGGYPMICQSWFPTLLGPSSILGHVTMNLYLGEKSWYWQKFGESYIKSWISFLLYPFTRTFISIHCRTYGFINSISIMFIGGINACYSSADIVPSWWCLDKRWHLFFVSFSATFNLIEKPYIEELFIFPFCTF
jgi:hypothetical protein